MSYHIDKNGNITQKKKKEEEGQRSYHIGRDGSITVLTPTDDEKEQLTEKEQLAGKVTDNNQGSKKRTWFSKGSFADGFDLTDIPRAIDDTLEDAGSRFVGSILDIGEIAVDTGAYLVGGVGKLFGADEFAGKTEEFIAKDLYDGKKVVKKILGTDKADMWDVLNIAESVAKGEDYERTDATLLGDKAGALIASGGQLAAQIGLQSVGVPWQVTSAITSFGGEVESAFQQGADYGAAGMSGVISAGTEILTEKLFGGSGLGETGVINVQKLTSGIANRAVKLATDYGIDILGEGAEEVVSQFFSNLGSALYKEEDLGAILFSQEALDGYLESFIGGSFLGGVMNVGKVKNSAKQGRDYRTGLTANEESVVSAEVESRIKQREQKGEKLSNHDKKIIRAEVEQDLQKGNISVDSIERYLGGSRFDSYNQEAAREKEVLAEFEKLSGLASRTPAQEARYKELSPLVDEIKNNPKSAEMIKQLRRDVFSMASKDNLARSYVEDGKRHKAFTADLSNYDAKQQEVIKKAIEAGYLNDTTRTHEFVDLIARLSAESGVAIDFTNNKKLQESGYAVGGRVVNGYRTSDGITININSAKALNSVVGHEITHILEGTELYQQMRDAVWNYALTKEGTARFNKRIKDTEELYKNIKDADVDGEITADLIGDYVFTDADFVRELSGKNRNLFQRIYDEIKYMLKLATAGSKEARELERVKKVFDKAFREINNASKDSKTNVNENVNTDGETEESKVELSTDAPAIETAEADVAPTEVAPTEDAPAVALADDIAPTQEVNVSPVEDVPTAESSVELDNAHTSLESLVSSQIDLSAAPESLKKKIADSEQFFAEKQFRDSLQRRLASVSKKQYDSIAEKYEAVEDAIYDAEADLWANPPAKKKGLFGRAKYSISKTTDGRDVAVVENDILSLIDTDNWDNSKKKKAQKAASVELKKFSNGFTINGIEFVGNKDTRDEYTRSNYTDALARKNPTAFLDKMRASSVIDDVVRVATDWKNDNGLTHSREDYVDFVRGNALIMSGGRGYRAVVLAGVTKDGKVIFHDVVDIYPDSFEIKKAEPSSAVLANESPNAILEDSASPTLAQEISDVKQFSLSENGDATIDPGDFYEVQAEVNRLTDSIMAFESTAEWKAMMDKVSEGIANGDVDRVIQEYNRFVEESGHLALIEKRNALRDSLERSRKKVEEDRISESVSLERKAIEESGLSEADYFRKQAVKEFGYTPYFYDAGYIVTNGKMLNFSGEKGKHFGSRGQDHRAIGTIYANTERSDALYRFVNEGNIRIIPESPGIDVSATTEPTKEQYATIKRFLYDYADKGYFAVDISDKDGRVVGSLEYENRIYPAKVIDDLKHYYETGEIRQRSKVSYSVSESLSEQENAYQYNLDNGDMDLAEMNVEEYANLALPDSKIRGKDGRLVPVYHGTKEMFWEFDTSKKGGLNGTAEGFGIYLSDDPEVTDAYGDRQIKMFANITKPATSTKKTISARTLVKLIEDTCKREAQKMVDDGEYDNVREAIRDTWVSNYVYTYDMTMEQAYREVANTFLQQNSSDMDIVQEVMFGMAIRSYDKAMEFYRTSLTPITGFDGFATQWENSGKKSNIYLAFDSSQLKSADAVTYDDNGNVIPLSERFNPEKKDIRYSLSAEADSDGNQLSYEQAEYFRDSKMRDADGNLMTMYHGTQKGGYHIFDPAYSDDDISLFFVDRNDVAMSYSGTSETYSARSFRAADDFNRFFAEIGTPEYEVREENGKFHLYDDGDLAIADADADAIYEEFRDLSGLGYGDVNYKVYLNLTHPLEVDAKGGSWDEIKIPREHLAKLNEIVYLTDDPYGYIDTASTRVFAEYAKAQGYDGVIFKNLQDNGGFSNGSEGASTVAIAFDSTQVKSVANGNPTANPDIRHSLSKEGAEHPVYGNYNVYGKDVALEDIAPVKETVIPTQEAVAPVAMFPDENVPESDADFQDRTDSLMDADAPPERFSYDDDIHADVIPLTKKVADDIRRNVRDSLALSNRQMFDVQEIVERYAQNEFPSREQLFRELRDKFGTYTESYTDEKVQDAKSFLRTYRLRVDDFIKSEVADYRDLMRRNFGKLRFSKDGTDVDVLYHELNSMWPHLFPDSIIAPTDQLMQIIDVANMDSVNEVERDLDDSAIYDVADSIIRSVSEYRQAQRENQVNRDSREAFNSLMRDADRYAPPADDAPVAESVDPRPVTEATASAPTEQPTVDAKVDAKLESLRTELAENQRLQAESRISYDEEIARLQAEYDAKKNKRSLSANDLLRRIARLKRMKSNVDTDYAKRIRNIEERLTKMSSPEYRTAEHRKAKQDEYTALMEELVGDTSTWVDKKLGISYKTNTLRRNLRYVVRDANGNRDIAKADAIYDELQGNYNHNNAILKRESAQIKKPYAELKITSAEDAYIQMLGELRYNPDTTLTRDVVDEYYEKHKKHIDTAKVDKVIEDARRTFDELLQRMNAVLREQGMKEIPYRKGYFPHFTDPKQGFLAKLFNWNSKNYDIPTDIAGLTEQFNPNRSWQAFNKQRTSDITDYSFTKGMDTYVHGALDWIHHIEDIQKRRALENYIRYIHSEQGVKDRIDKIRNSDEYDADEMQEQIDLVYAEASNPLNNFVVDLRAGTNALTGKKSSLDRGMEEKFNRTVYDTMTNLSNRVSANMVVGSISSALTNFIPITQSWGQVSPISSLRAMVDTIRSTIRDDGLIDKSDFLTNRLRSEESLYKTGWDRIGEVATILMEGIDSFTSQTVWRSKYLENISKHMSESEAIKNADQFAENVIAGRSRGNMPTIFESKNLWIKTLTAFQLEVANQYGYMFQDMPQDMRNQSILKLVKGYTTMFMGAYAYNALYSSLVGRDAAFDPIGIVEDLLRDLGLFDDDEEEEKEISDAIVNFGENILGEVPFVGGLVGGGRVPISAALPYDGIFDAYSGTTKDIANEDWGNLTKEWLKPIYYLAMPMGGGQLKKSIEGVGMFLGDHPVAGSYTNSGDLRFPVEPTAGNIIQSGLFGQYSNENARYYFDNDIAPLNEKQIQEYIDVDIPIRDYWDYRKGLKGKDTLGEKVAYISSLDLPIDKKNLLVNNQANRAEPIDLTDYNDYDGWGEFDYAQKYPEKYDFLQSNGITAEQYEGFDEDTKKAYSWAYQNPEKFALSKVVTDDLMEYRSYTGDLSDIEADKDEYGKSISGSRKEKVISYINGLNLDYGAKIVLFKSQYSSDDTYNYEIVDYIESRPDLDFEEKKAILEELDFVVYDDGRVEWD